MRFRHTLLYWSALWSVLPGLLFAGNDNLDEDKSDSSVSTLAQVIAKSDTATPEELWRGFVDSGFELSSLPGRPKGFFEFWAFRRASDDDGRQNSSLELSILFDDREERRILLFPGEDFLPAKIGINERCLSVGNSGEWELRKQEGWVVAFDEAHMTNFASTEGVPSDPKGFIKFNPGSYLSGLMKSEVPSVTWDGPTRTLVAKKSNGTTVRLRFRTPNDQRRFGTALGEFAIQSSNGLELSFRSFIVDRESPLRLNLPEFELLPRRLGAVDKIGTPLPARAYFFDSPEEVKAALRLEEEIGYLDCDTGAMEQIEVFTRPPDDPDEPVVVTLIAGKQVEMVQGPGPKTPNAFADLLTERLEENLALIESAITKGSADSIIDDPCILWRGFERGISARYATFLLKTTVWQCLVAEPISLARKIRLCMAMGEYGAPAWAPLTPPLPGEHGTLLLAILHARWNWIPTDEELALCRDKLRDEQSSALEKEAAIDCLIRWGKLEEIPGERMDDWFNAKLAASRMHRHCTWKALTRTEDGREFLLERIESLASRPEIQQALAKVLCLRADAALETKRYDFMTAEECHRTLRVCTPYCEASASHEIDAESE